MTHTRPHLPKAPPQDVRFFAARLAHVPLADVFRRLMRVYRWPRTKPLAPALVAVLERRAEEALEHVWRRRLFWLLGETLFCLDEAVERAAEAYTRALECPGPRSAAFDIACLRNRAICWARVGLPEKAEEDQTRMHALLEGTVEPRRRAFYLFYLGEEQFADYGLLELACENYISALHLFERLGDTDRAAECLHNQGLCFFYRWDLERALAPMLAARRLWRRIGDAPNVHRVDSDLIMVFACRREPRRSLGAATRTYLAEVSSGNSKHFLAYALWARAEALHTLGRRSDRNASARQAIWLGGSDIGSVGAKDRREKALERRVKLLWWHLADGDIAGAREVALLALPDLPWLDACEPQMAVDITRVFGRMREILCREDLAFTVRQMSRPTDQLVPPDALWLRPNHPFVGFYLGRGMLGG